MLLFNIYHYVCIVFHSNNNFNIVLILNNILITVFFDLYNKLKLNKTIASLVCPSSKYTILPSN